MQRLEDIRKEYSRTSLDVKNVSADPIEQFNIWFNEAMSAGVPEPNAMSLATVGSDHRPSCRIVLLKGVENNQFVFYTNYQSHKGKDLDNNPFCALTFFWPELERQVRIEGSVTRVDDYRSETYFQSRPVGSQIGAWSSPQSSVIGNREILEERVQQISKRFEGATKLPKPKQWGGFQVAPYMIEFWQGRQSRLHDRIVFTLADGAWGTHRLAP
ncbi:pyridoxamine 5'-phosphate oxidase [Chryseolinea sp. T2]|uniref:pyridoxamine 5'-phosphate oxidase n=1 Tax=Chryseolinea sp. T2 TaxID=3129255 RepID=UPI003077A702